jgi:hypothetical protein
MQKLQFVIKLKILVIKQKKNILKTRLNSQLNKFLKDFLILKWICNFCILSYLTHKT